MALSDPLIVAIVFGVLGLVFNKQILDGCIWVYRNRPWSAENYCYQILWRDLFSHPDDEIHTHEFQFFYDRCSCSIQSHNRDKKCWSKTISRVFTRASKVASIFPEKPPGLWVDASYLRTQANVVLAYFICTVRCNNFDPAMLGSRSRYIVLERKPNLILAHLGSPNRILNITPREIQAILDGSPPFYRQKFSTPEGHELINRPSSKSMNMPCWIIAVGLGHLQPTDVYLSRTPNAYMSAIGDIATILEALFKGRFPGAKVQWAITSCREIEHGINPARFPGVVRDADNPYPTASLATDTIEYPPNIHPLTKDQCEALLDVFQAKDITDYQAEILKPAIFNAMERIVLGVVVVLRYFRSYDRQMTIPTELLGDRTVYLRDCEWDCEWGMQGFLRS